MASSTFLIKPPPPIVYELLKKSLLKGEIETWNKYLEFKSIFNSLYRETFYF